jgi:hypothetical protein
MEKLTQPGGLYHAVGNNVILGLCARARDNGLSLGGPRDKVGAQEHVITRSGLVCDGTTSLGIVDVNHELQRREGPEHKVIVEGAMEVAQDPLESSEMGSHAVCMCRHICWTV